MVRVLVVLKGGYPWGFRMQGGGDKPLVVSKVTSTGKAGGAGVRAGCVVRAINGTPTTQLSLSHAHGLTKQGSTLTLEIEDNSEEPVGASLSSSTSICSSNSASTSSTVVAANGHISTRRRADSGGSSERTREPQSDDRTIPDHDRTEDSDTSVIILETYGANPNILRANQEEESTDTGAEASEESLPATSDSSLNLSDYSSSLDPSGSYESDDGNNTDHSSQTDTSTDTLVCDVSQCESDQTKTKEKCTEYDLATGALIEYPNEDSEDESLIRSSGVEDLSSTGENGDSLFYNFEEELERVERQYPNLQAKDLLTEEEVEGEEEQETHTIVSHWACEGAKEGSRCFTITEEGEEEDKEGVERQEKLETTMGQYYSSGSGGGVSRGDMSGSLPSSPRSSEEWRMSMASTATVASTATAGSDDTVAKDMSELSSINSRLSYLDEAQDEVKNGPTTPPTVDANGALKATPQLDHKRQASIKDAIDELESIEQAAQTLLQKRQYPTEEEGGKPFSGSETMTIHSSTAVIVTTVTVGEKVSPLPERKIPPSPLLQRHLTDNQNELSEKSGKERLEKYEKSVTETSARKEDKKIPSVKPDDGDHFQKTEILASPENLMSEGEPATKPLMEDQIPDSKSEVKPPLPPVTGSQPAKLDVKRRCLTRSKELQPYISRESYDDDRVLKELERLRRSYQESDLNDFLDALEHTPISDDLEEAFLRQLLADISEDVEGTQGHGENSTQLQEEGTLETTESVAQVSSDIPAESPQPSPAAGKFEKVKERILEMITVRKTGRVIYNGSLESPPTPNEDVKQVNDSGKDNSGLLEASQICRSVTPQPLRPDTPDSKSSRPHTPDVAKGEDNKKGFNIADLLKKGSPKYLRKKYKERKNRKSDLMTTSESESEDPDGSKKDSKYHNGVSLKKETSTESQSSLKGSNRSLTSSQEVKKEVRFDLEDSGDKKELEESESKGGRADSTKPVKVEETTKEYHRISGPQLITCEAQQQETVILREFEETTEEMDSDLTVLLPSTVEDINNRTESLLPRLPERPRPPRKKKKLIPTSVEELSGELSDNSSSPVNSDESVKIVDPKIESLKINLGAKEESPPPLPSYEEVSELPETSPKCVEVVGGNSLESKTQDEREESMKISVTSENATAIQTPPCSTVSLVTVALDTTMTSSSVVTTDVPLSSLSSTTVTSSCSATTDGTEVSMKGNDIPDSVLSASTLASTATTPAAATDVSTSAVDDGVLIAPLPISSIVSISVAPTPETATLVMYPPRSLPLPVIQESLQEDQVSLPTPNEPRVSLSSHSGSAPVTPQDEEEKVPSLYDNVNPFKEMLEIESKLLQDTASESPSETNSSVEIQTETVKEEVAQEPETRKKGMKADHFDFPQEACKSPDLENTEIVDIDALAALTTEMFRFTEDMDMGVPKKESKPLIDPKASVRKVDAVSYMSISSSGPKYMTDGSASEPIKTGQHPDTLISTTDSPKPQEFRKNAEMKETVTQTEPDTTSRSMSVKEMATSNTVGVQTDATRYVRMYDTASQTDTEYETDLETESEMEENGTSKYDVSKWLFRPTKQNKVPLPVPKDPQLQELHKQQQMMIQELQQQTAMQQRRQKEKPEVPPRQFQEKMPLKVVDELKAVLSESEDAAPRLKKVVEPPPRWDSKFSWDDALQELGLDESTLLTEIEQILGFGSLSSKNRAEKPSKSSSSQPDIFERPVKLEKQSSREKSSEKPLVPERDSSKGVWSPGKPGDERDASGPSRIDLPDLPSFKDQPSVWSPGRAGSASPSLGRKEYRKITYEGTSTPQRRPSQEIVTAPSPEESFAWKDIAVDKVARSPTSTLPKVQNPTVTLLQKKREGQIPGKRPEYLKPDDTGPKYKPDDKLYVIKREYESEDEEGGRRFAVLGPKKVLGVGPTTSDGVPTTLKSGVKSEHQGEWYRRMFDSLHKVKDDDHIIIKYKVPRARYGGYMSEPEGYDSDVCSSRYSTLDRRRQHHYEMDPMTTSLPRNTNRYVHQPGRIEDYIPGYSSLSEKELKKNPDADVKLESQTQEPPPVSVNHRLGSQKMSIAHALKESGYESDSTLVFRKREDARRQVPDPRKTSQVYRQIQRGGDIPLTGLQKPNPPKPRESPYKYESGEVNIHYRTPVRLEQKEAIPEEELARRQEEHMKKVYENERRKKYLAELEDIERRRHTDNFTPLQKSPIPLNRYDDDSSLGTMRGTRTPDLKQVAKALYNFTAQNKRELTFNKGDVVFIRRQIDKNWYEGESRGSVGIFPCNYVEIVPYESIKTLTRKPTEGQARARFNFQAQTSMEMSLSKGELVVLTRRVDENWYEGRIGNRKGIFPVSYVDTLVEPGSDRPMTPSSSPMPRPALPAANLLYNGASSYSSPYSTLGRPESQNDSRPYTQSLTVNTQQEPVAYRALYNYKPQNDDELELLESDIVMVMEKCDDGWFVGTSRRTGLFGTFPGNYVERV